MQKAAARRGWTRRRLRCTRLRARACPGPMELRLQLFDLGVCVCLGLLDASLVQLLASLVLGLPLRLLGHGDLVLDVGRRPAQDP